MHNSGLHISELCIHNFGMSTLENMFFGLSISELCMHNFRMDNHKCEFFVFQIF
ncbi:hypothetical protein JHK82_021724 [Glycine max]|uniref:Uncharacterized protein n=2 Tax=Glycine subgen. Soja TaxID=1462606 RepID=K7L7F8_SOYBN|nr:hypothetical protein JHK85_022184 [Glycine max]RZB97528.1 hypothetical protein D0Y65_020918 [Glycine soja]KAG5025830.1 hypothetical protein JHK86_021744 [Glycine max]KAG5136993.1 hypothetical protein JHK82_021724 [Glycine max]KAH1051841.1 hypothetical protein GYH30_021641 [Glycine max]